MLDDLVADEEKRTVEKPQLSSTERLMHSSGINPTDSMGGKIRK